MSGIPVAGHEEWDELAAGSALHALEPAEEQRFEEHLPTCARCASALDEHRLVAAQLGSLADRDNADRPDWSRLRAGIVGAATPAPDVVVPLASRRRRLPQLVAVAAAVVVLAAVGVTVWRASGTSPSPAARAVAACHRAQGCQVVQLRAAHGAVPAVVLVSADHATVVPMAMKPTNAGHTYVLWQMLRTGGPTPVTSFRSTTAPSTSTLVMPYDDTAAFAVSLEAAGVPPSQPSDVLAVGTTPA